MPITRNAGSTVHRKTDSHGNTSKTQRQGSEPAIKSLEASTKAIDGCTEILEQQREFLDAYKKKNNVGPSKTSHFEQERERKYQTKIQQLKFINSDLLSDLQSRLSSEQEKTDRAIKTFPSRVSGWLKADDKALEILEQNLDRLPRRKSSDSYTESERVEQLLSALHRTTTSTLKDRLDRIYLQELQDDFDEGYLGPDDHDDTTNGSDTDQVQKQLEDEIQSLYTEIDDVASMLIHHQHGRKIQQTTEMLGQEQKTQSIQAKKQATSHLKSLTSALNALADQADNLKSHQQAIHEIGTHLDLNITNPAAESTPQQQSSPKDKKRSEQIKNNTDTAALATLLQHMDITADISTSSQAQMKQELTAQIRKTSKESNTKIQNLEETLKLVTLARTEQVAMLMAAPPSTNDTDVDIDDVQEKQEDNLFASEIELIGDLDERVARAKSEVENLGSVTAASMDGGAALVRSWQLRQQQN